MISERQGRYDRLLDAVEERREAEERDEPYEPVVLEAALILGQEGHRGDDAWDG